MISGVKSYDKKMVHETHNEIQTKKANVKHQCKVDSFARKQLSNREAAIENSKDKGLYQAHHEIFINTSVLNHFRGKETNAPVSVTIVLESLDFFKSIMKRK